MELIRIIHENLEKEHICCAISNNKDIQISSKKAWLKDCLDEGLVFLKGDVRGKCFIEYIPTEFAWSRKLRSGENRTERQNDTLKRAVRAEQFQNDFYRLKEALSEKTVSVASYTNTLKNYVRILFGSVNYFKGSRKTSRK